MTVTLTFFEPAEGKVVVQVLSELTQSPVQEKRNGATPPVTPAVNVAVEPVLRTSVESRVQERAPSLGMAGALTLGTAAAFGALTTVVGQALVFV